MADNYLQFSFAIHELTPSEEAWFKNLVVLDEEYGSLCSQASPDEELPEPTGLLRFSEDPEYLDFNVAVDTLGDEKILWIWTDDSGTPESAAMFVQAFLKENRPDECEGFEWASSCSKPRLNAFGGGAIFVTADDIQYMYSGQWLLERYREFKGE